VQAVIADIGAALRISIGSDRLAAALANARSVTGWSDAALAAYCFEKLRDRRKKVDLPSAWLATDLARLDARKVPSPRMAVAVVLADFKGCHEDWRTEQIQEGNDPDSTFGPLDRFEEELIKAELVKDDAGIPPWWKVEEADIEQVAHWARLVIGLFELRRFPVPSPPTEQPPTAVNADLIDDGKATIDSYASSRSEAIERLGAVVIWCAPSRDSAPLHFAAVTEVAGKIAVRGCIGI
jgi:hypothetical protein